MATNEVIGLSAEMKVQQALDELKRLGPGADKEAKAIAASLGKALKDSEKAAKKLGEEMAKAGKAGSAGLKDAAVAAESLGNGGSKALKALGPLGGVLSRISPEAGAAASALAGLTSAFEGFGIEGGAFAGAIGASLPLLAAGAIAVGEIAGVMDDYTASSKAATAAHAAFAAALAPMEDAVAAARAEQERLNAALESGSAKKYLAISDLSAAADVKEAAATANLRAEKDALMQTLAESANMDNFAGQVAQNRIKDIDQQIAAVHAQGNELARLTVTNYTLRGAIDATGAATAAHAVKARDLTAELLKEAAAAQAAADNFGAHLAAVEASAASADEVVARSAAFRLSEIDKLSAEEDAAVADYATRAKAGALTDEQIAADTATIRANYEDQITAKMGEEQAKREADARASAERMAAAQEASTARTVGMITDSAQVAASVLTSLGDSAEATYSHAVDMADRLTGQLAAGEEYYTEAQKAALQKRIAAQREAAHKAFQAQKAAGVATATVQLFVAEAQAVASAPWPYNIPAIAEAAIAGGAAVAGAASVQEPTFHRGRAPDEIPATILRKEAVMTPTAANSMGPKQIDRLNDGQTRGGYSGPAPVILGHRVVNDLIKRELQNSGALMAALSAGTILGHRTNRRGVTG